MFVSPDPIRDEIIENNPKLIRHLEMDMKLNDSDADGQIMLLNPQIARY